MKIFFTNFSELKSNVSWTANVEWIKFSKKLPEINQVA